MKKIVKIGLLGIALLSPVIAQAAPITITATGQVSGSYDSFGYFGLGTGSNTLLGAFVTATWTFDSDAAGTDTDSSATRADFRPATNWVDSSISFDTSTIDSDFNVSDAVIDADDFRDRMILDNEHGSTNDWYQITDFSKNLSTGEFAVSTAQIYSISDDLINSLDPAQVLNWSADDYADDNGSGRFQYSYGSQFAYADYVLDTFVVSVGSSVPEPSTLALLALGLAGFRLRRKTI